MKKRIFSLILSAVLLLSFAGCGGKQPEIPQNMTFETFDFSGVNSLDMKNLHTGKETQIIYPDQLRELTDFMKTIRGTSPVSGRGFSGGSYELTFKKDFAAVLTLEFGDDGSFLTGDFGDGYPIRYTLEGLTGLDVANFLSLYEKKPEPTLSHLSAGASPHHV